MTPTPTMTRRALVAGLAVLPAWAAAQPSLLLPTPPGMRGPFYPETFPADTDADLVLLRCSDARAAGTVAHVGGRVLALDGTPVAGAAV